MSNGLGALGAAFGGSFENVPNMGNNQQGGQQGNAGQQGGMPQQSMPSGDVPPFQLPPAPDMSGGMPGSDSQEWSPYYLGGQGAAHQMPYDDYSNMMHQQMTPIDPQIMDALRLAQQSQQPQMFPQYGRPQTPPQYDMSQMPQQNYQSPQNMGAILNILRQLGVA